MQRASVNSAAFVLSTGRCGTQWLAYIFNKYYQAELYTAHEPIDNKYNSRYQLAWKDHQDFLAHTAEEVSNHLDSIQSIIKEKSYLETGHPSWSSIQYLPSYFKGQMKIIFLTRDPVSMAKSWMAHGAFSKPFLPHQKMKTLISPRDAGVRFPNYMNRWDKLSQFEKLIYYWLEVNIRGWEIMSESEIPMIHIKFEELFSEPKLKEFVNFLGLPMKDGMLTEFEKKVDKFNYYTYESVNENLLENHPDILELMHQLHY